MSGYFHDFADDWGILRGLVPFKPVAVQNRGVSEYVRQTFTNRRVSVALLTTGAVELDYPDYKRVAGTLHYGTTHQFVWDRRMGSVGPDWSPIVGIAFFAADTNECLFTKMWDEPICATHLEELRVTYRLDVKL